MRTRNEPERNKNCNLQLAACETGGIQFYSKRYVFQATPSCIPIPSHQAIVKALHECIPRGFRCRAEPRTPNPAARTRTRSSSPRAVLYTHTSPHFAAPPPPPQRWHNTTIVYIHNQFPSPVLVLVLTYAHRQTSTAANPDFACLLSLGIYDAEDTAALSLSRTYSMLHTSYLYHPPYLPLCDHHICSTEHQISPMPSRRS